jgi:glycine betaine/proline transport system ATP-binding protein
MLRIEKLYKIFGHKPQVGFALLQKGENAEQIRSRTGQVVAVEDVSFELRSGEILVIMGLSGSGKSTLLRCVNRLTEPTLGRVFLDKRDDKAEEIEITKLNREGLRRLRMTEISMVFQDFGLFPFKTIIENVALGLKIQGVDKESRKRRAMEVLEMVGLKKWGDASPSELSGGMQQRVGLARALATGAEILLMDEPFSALDPLIRYNLQDELMKLQVDLNKSILFVSHDLAEALRLGDRIAIMEAGKFIQVDTPERILINPKTEYVKKFVETADATNTITAKTLAEENMDLQVKQRSADGVIKFCVPENGKEINFILGSNGEFENCSIAGNSVSSRIFEDERDLKDIHEREIVLLVNEEKTIKAIIKAAQHSSLPIGVVSQKGVFLGIITQKEIFKGILKELKVKNCVSVR